MTRARCATGLVLVELAAAVAIVAVLAALLLIAAGESRRQSSLGDNLANLKQFASATGSYAADNDDRMWAFSWQAGVNYGFGGIASTSYEAAANQAVEIIRRRANRPDLAPIAGWFPNVTGSHLVLLDYLGTAQPERFVAGPEDWQRLLWQTSVVPDWNGYFRLVPNVERPPGTSNADKRWPYSSSYAIPPAFLSPDARSRAPSYNAVTQGPTHTSFLVTTSTPLGGRRLSEVRHPAQKVMLYEEYQRHFGPQTLFFGYPEARIPIMLADGSAAVRRTADANRGFQPDSPTSNSFTFINFAPASWEPRTLSGAASQTVTAYYRFTRSGLRGRDFGGREVPWVD